MVVTVHFLDVGQGNMVIMNLDNGQNIVYDCNITQDNEASILSYLNTHLGYNGKIDLFINSHREADHMSGIHTIHSKFPIQKLWDNGCSGNNSISYQRYMNVRRNVPYACVKSGTRYTYGNTVLRVLSANDPELPNDGNCKSIVVKVFNAKAGEDCSVMLTGDSDARTWQRIIQNYNNKNLALNLKSKILLGGHHGSDTFFDDPSDKNYYYEGHIRAIAPDITVLSVGENNQHGHPHDAALKIYDKHSTGCTAGNKILRTDKHGHIVVTLNDDGAVKYTVEYNFATA